MSCGGTKKAVENKPNIEVKTVSDIEKEALLDTIQISIEEKTPYENNIHKLWDELLKKYVSNSGKVNYNALKENHEELLEYIKILQATYEKRSLTKDESLAFWINAYNAMTIDLILKHYPIKSIKDIKEPWKQRYWKLGNKWYNLNDIEHSILRKMNEPRIHFAIVCASFSCPKLQNEAFSNINLDKQLTRVTKQFLNDSDRNSITENNIELSKIFKWFSSDFKQNGSLIDFLNQYSDITISNKAKISFKTYNWNLNE